MRSATHRWWAIALVVVSSSLCTSCKSAKKKQTGNEASSASSREPSLRDGTHVIRSLLEEGARAELWERGLFINLGTPDQHKYVRGTWRTGWGRAGIDNETIHLEARRTARLTLHDWFGGCTAVVIRARSDHPRQKLTLYVDDKAVSTRRVTREWKTLEYPLAEPTKPGRRRVTLTFTRSGNKRAALVDWLWLKTKGDRPPRPVKVAPLKLDSPQRALVAAPPRTLSFYLEVPEKAALVFDYGGSPGTRFTVQVATDGAPVKSLFSATSKKKRWTEARVDLAGLAGQLVRLDLVTEGNGETAGWGEPDLVRTGRAPEVPAVSSASRAKNLIYILIDTARQDVYSPFNPETRVKAPALARLARESTIFKNAYCNSNWTNPSVATVLTGVYPFTHKVKEQDSVVPSKLPFVSEHLKKHGFTTAAFIANGYTSKKFGFKRGWDHYRNYIVEKKPSEAEHVYKDATAWITEQVSKRKSERFFLYIQTIDPHVPYDVPPEYREPYYEGRYKGKLGAYVSGKEVQEMTEGRLPASDDDKRYTRALYDAEITYHDEHFGLFIEKLRELGALDDALLIVSNDHGEEMFEHGHIGHGHSLYEELIRALLLVRYPKLFPKGKLVREAVELVDMVPTELEVLGVPHMHGVEGVSLLGAAWGKPPMAGSYAINEYQRVMRAVRVGRFKQIQHKSNPRDHRLFDLVADRGELEDLTRSHPLAWRACEVYLGEGLHIQHKGMRLSRMTRPAPLSASRAKIDPGLRRQLQALGYLNK